MPEIKILILGGYGQTGLAVARLLLQETSAAIVLAGRDITKARLAASSLNKQLNNERVEACYADAADPSTLISAFTDVRLVLVTSSTAEYTQNVAEAVLKTGSDYMDIHFGPSVYGQLQLLESKIREAGSCFISGGGFHPGMPAIMIRYGALLFDEIHTARTAGLMKIDFRTYNASPSTRIEFVEELAGFNPLYLADRKWKKMNMLTGSGMRTFDFRNNYGKCTCSPLFFEELRPLPQQYPSLRDTGFYIAGFNLVTDYFIFPFVMLCLKIVPRRFNNLLAKLMVWSIKTFTRPPYGYVMKLEAKGLKNGREKNIQLWIRSMDPAFITAVPVVACIKQYLQQNHRTAGLQVQGQFAEPIRFIDDCRCMGLDVELEEC